MRSSQRPPFDLMSRKLATAVSSEPKCNGPLGVGANLPVGIRLILRHPYSTAIADLNGPGMPGPHLGDSAVVNLGQTCEMMCCFGGRVLLASCRRARLR